MTTGHDTPPWRSEREVDAALAARLVEAWAPELTPARVELLGTGWDNTVFRVNDAWVFRFPRRESAVALLEAELRVLPTLAPKLPLPIPVPAFAGKASLGYPWPFAGYRHLPGRVATEASLTASQRTVMAPLLGRFLCALHALDPAELGAPPDTHARLDLAAKLPVVAERLARLGGRGVLSKADADAWLARFETEAARTPAPAPPPAGPPRCLVHGDLYAGQLLVDAAGALTAIIDWGDVHAGHPAVDLSLVYAFLPPAARPAFESTYGPLGDATRRLAWLRAVHHTVMVVAYGHDAGRPELLREGLAALEHLRPGP